MIVFFQYMCTIQMFHLNNLLHKFPNIHLCLKIKCLADEVLLVWKNIRVMENTRTLFYTSYCFKAFFISDMITGKTSSQWLVSNTLVLWANSGQYNSDHKSDSKDICSTIGVQCWGYSYKIHINRKMMSRLHLLFPSIQLYIFIHRKFKFKILIRFIIYNINLVFKKQCAKYKETSNLKDYPNFSLCCARYKYLLKQVYHNYIK